MLAFFDPAVIAKKKEEDPQECEGAAKTSVAEFNMASGVRLLFKLCTFLSTTYFLLPRLSFYSVYGGDGGGRRNNGQRGEEGTGGH